MSRFKIDMFSSEAINHLGACVCQQLIIAVCGQAEWERSRKELDKARHDVERLRRALDKAAVEKRDQQQKVAATRDALQV